MTRMVEKIYAFQKNVIYEENGTGLDREKF